MVGLLDIAPLAREVPVAGQNVAVTGVSAAGVAALLQRFPELKSIMAGRGTLDAESLFTLVPSAIASIIAAGCGYPGNEEAEAKASTLVAEDQMSLLMAIVEMTLPKGVGPFLDRLMGIVGQFEDASAKIPDIKSPSPSKS